MPEPIVDAVPGRPDVSIVVLSWNTQALLRQCLDALRLAEPALRQEVIVIDNASADGSADVVTGDYPEVRLVRNAENRGYAPAVNQGLALATGAFVCLLGSDTRVRPGTIAALRDFLLAHPEAGAVAPPLLNEDGTRQQACKRFPTLATALFWDTALGRLFPRAAPLARYEMREWDHHGTREVDQPPGTCFFVPRAVIDAVGPMDERLWLFYNDVDWAKRIREHGYSIWYVDCPGVYHRESSSVRNFPTMSLEWHRNRIAYYRKHHGVAGSLLTKSLAFMAALRHCGRSRRDFPAFRPWFAHAKGVMALAMRVMRDG